MTSYLNLSFLYIDVQKEKENLLNNYLLKQRMEEVNLKQLILRKLIRGNVWGGKHTPLDFIKKGIPNHYRNTHQGKKALEHVLKELVNAEWVIILTKRTGSGADEHISLNPRKVGEIKQFLEETSTEYSSPN